MRRSHPRGRRGRGRRRRRPLARAFDFGAALGDSNRERGVHHISALTGATGTGGYGETGAPGKKTGRTRQLPSKCIERPTCSPKSAQLAYSWSLYALALNSPLPRPSAPGGQLRHRRVPNCL